MQAKFGLAQVLLLTTPTGPTPDNLVTKCGACRDAAGLACEELDYAADFLRKPV